MRSRTTYLLESISERRQNIYLELSHLAVWLFVPVTIYAIYATGWLSGWTIASASALLVCGFAGAQNIMGPGSGSTLRALAAHAMSSVAMFCFTIGMSGVVVWAFPDHYLLLLAAAASIMPILIIMLLIRDAIMIAGAYRALRRTV